MNPQKNTKRFQMNAKDVIGTIESVLKQFNASSFMLRMRRINVMKKWSDPQKNSEKKKM